jgi:hypothetical protein
MKRFCPESVEVGDLNISNMELGLGEIKENALEVQGRLAKFLRRGQAS